MKTSTFKYTFLTAIILFFVACSTKKNTFVSRNYHALTTRDNVLYNGNLALEKGIVELKSQYKDNFWSILPVERMQISEEQMMPGQNKNQNFEVAETKATKAIQKHSMNIGGSEKNPQIDEAHLLLGKTRYYDQRFIPALEAFNYVLYKYPTSSRIQEVKIWREKTNMRMDNDATAVVNLKKLLGEIKFKDQIFADANAALAQAYLNLEEDKNALAKLKIATEFTKSNEEKARYRFIEAQIYERLGHKDSAYAKYQEVIDMKRKSARQYVIQAHARQAAQFDYKKGDTIAFLEKFRLMLKDRENRPFLDVLNHQMALFYDKQNNSKEAIGYYNKSIKKRSNDTYLLASNYRNLADIYFNKAKYVTAGKYFDSTLTVLNSKSREFKLITKKRENLDDVIKFEGIAQRNDSILKVASLSKEGKEKYYKDFIETLKKEDAKKAADEAKLNGSKEKEQSATENASAAKSSNKPITPVSLNSGSGSTFYFYNPSTVAFGVVEFKKKWGDRAHVLNWRLSKEAVKDDKNPEDSKDAEANSDNSTKEVNEKYAVNYYTKQIPTSSKILDSIAKERNFAYYQLGVIYKEKFKEYKRAADKLEKLLENKPEERLILPSMYNLYKIYEIIDKEKALVMKNKIIAQYPDSRYAQILNNSGGGNLASSSPEVAYNELFRDFEKEKYREILPKLELAIEQYTGEEMLPKFELLKANVVGKLKGVAEFKKALNYVALSYPNSEEGKNTEIYIATKIPYLESLSFNSEFPLSWNILYKADDLTAKSTKDLLDKITKFAKERTIEKLTVSTDIYTLESNFLVIHGIKSAESASGIAHVLKEYKDYKISEPAIVISSENYKVVQVKKNITDYIAGDWLNKPIVPIQRDILIPVAKTENKNQEAVKSKNQGQDPANNNQAPAFKGKQNTSTIPPMDVDPTDSNLDNATPKSANPGFPKKP
ncbi:tetratricopeptide repeat protein [Flavobacterium sp.]|uniref:type IX secretion system periplasmic lipoprotein PorW/SprE n=1 Tax=Flavobacterium sp. TaxID=239 RepID=UPI0038D0A48E